MIGVTTSRETITLAEFVGTGWSLMDYNWCLKFEKKSGKDGHLFELVGNRVVSMYILVSLLPLLSHLMRLVTFFMNECDLENAFL